MVHAPRPCPAARTRQGRPGRRDQSSVTPDCLTTSAQRLISLSTKPPNCAPVTLGMVDPLPAQISLILGVFSALVTSAIILSTTGWGVPAGAHIAYQVDTS